MGANPEFVELELGWMVRVAPKFEGLRGAGKSAPKLEMLRRIMEPVK